ncbi:MAG: sugar transferase [Acidimicrobiia bacterium]|nr:sugar transferase [Acidimicrobiia bacterium]
MLTLMAPVIGLAALAVYLETGGPVLYRALRVGKDGVDFEMLKLRTMRTGSDGLSITASGDPRVTRIGSILRHTKIDELPQLINVLRGEMSLVGPRPEVRRYVDMFPSEFSRIHSVLPGITGVGSLAYRNESEILGRYEQPEEAYVTEILPDKLALETRYVERRSLFTNLELIARTLKSVIYGS